MEYEAARCPMCAGELCLDKSRGERFLCACGTHIGYREAIERIILKYMVW